MALSDAIGSGPDFTADSVIDRVLRSILPDLPENVSADAVLNRLNRKLTLAKSDEAGGKSSKRCCDELRRRSLDLFLGPYDFPIGASIGIFADHA